MQTKHGTMQYYNAKMLTFTCTKFSDLTSMKNVEELNIKSSASGV